MKKMLISLFDPKVAPTKTWNYVGNVNTLGLYVALAILLIHRLFFE